MSVFIIADAGSNARPSLRTAERLIFEAKHAGADAIKFQLWHADHLYRRGTTEHAEAKRWALPEKWLPALKARCDEVGAEFMCTTFCSDALDLVDPLVRRHKIAGIEAHDRGFVNAVLAKRKPIILTRSLGLPSWQLASYRLGALLAGAPLTVLVGVTAYPAPPTAYGLLQHPRGSWGISDHTWHPTVLPVAATALGASVIEKHICLARQRKTPDAGHSLIPVEFEKLTAAVRMAERALVKTAPDAELGYHRFLRKNGLRGG